MYYYIKVGFKSDRFKVRFCGSYPHHSMKKHEIT